MIKILIFGIRKEKIYPLGLKTAWICFSYYQLICFFVIFQSEPVVVKPNEAGERLDDLIKSLQKVSSATPTTLSKSSSSSSSSAAVSSTSSSFKPQPLPPGGAAEASAMVNHMQV